MIETDVSDWDRTESGEIEAFPVVNWAVAAIPHAVLLRLEILDSPGRIGTAQLVLDGQQAEEMAQYLMWMVQRSRSNPASGQA